MDAYGSITVLLLMLSSITVSTQMVPDESVTATVVDGDADNAVSSTAATLSGGREGTVENRTETACVTPKSLSGACVTRQMCEYSTPAVDLTLYAYRGYSNPCALGEVCCPVEFLRKIEDTSPAPSQEFQFDEDD